jgi:hypothetical protein
MNVRARGLIRWLAVGFVAIAVFHMNATVAVGGGTTEPADLEN